jgi:hypothetical protein
MKEPDMADDRNREGARTNGGAQLGGAPGASDMAAPGGSSGTGGYGNDQNAQNQGPDAQSQAPDPGQSRGERFDEAQGGGRGADTVSVDQDRDGDDFAEDQQAHQDRGQSAAGDEEVE